MGIGRGSEGSLMGIGRGSEGSRMTGTGSAETGREAGGGSGGRTADAVRERGTGRSEAEVRGCTDAVLDGGGVAIEIRMGGGGGGGGEGIPEETGNATSGSPFCFIISIICFTVNPISCAILMKVWL